MTDRPLTVKEAAEFLSVNPWQIRYYINGGQLKACKIGNDVGTQSNRKHWRIWKQDLLEFLNKGVNAKES